MRLTDSEKNKIITVISSYITDGNATLLLYGSRTDDAKKGGDLDLLLLASDATSLNRHKHYILADLKIALDDQKIDLIITDEKSISGDAFLGNAIKAAIILHEW